MKKVFVFSLLALITFAGCKKYEDGPTISLASKKARLVNVWKLDKAFVNGTELTLTTDDKDDYTEFKKDGVYSETTVVNNVSNTTTGTWDFDDSKDNVIISYTYGSITVTSTSKILRLKSKELWMEHVDGNTTYKYYFIPK